MKNLCLIISCVFLLFNSVSQTPLVVPKIIGSEHVEAADKKVVKRNVAILSNSSRGTASNEIHNATDYIPSYLGSTPYFGFTNPIFPDSNVIVFDTSGNNTPWLHGICQTFDLGGGYLSSTGSAYDPAVQPFCEDELFTVDSIWINGLYHRTNDTVVDTAVISIIAKNYGNYTRAYNIGRRDSLIYVVDDVDRDNSPDSKVWTGKIILDSTFYKDTVAGGGHLFKINASQGITNSNGIIGITLEFKPGNNYSQATDTIYKNQNYIEAVYATPQGKNTSFPLGQVTNDVTSGSFCDNNTKYSTGLNFNYYLPPIVFATDHPYQLYDVSVQITQQLSTPFPCYVGIDELKNEAKVFQNFPNPTSGITTIKYLLENSAAVSFEMFDITGKIVVSSNEGTKGTGAHAIEINTAELTAGIYFYSVIVNNYKMTKKMTIFK